MENNICPKCNKGLIESEIVDWDDDSPIYECTCGCVFDTLGNDLTEEYEE